MTQENKSEQPQGGKNRQIPVLSFENWLLTATGKRCMSMKGLTEEYMKNRLWWAFHAGNTANQVWMTSEVQQIFEGLIGKKTIPKYIQKKIEYVLNNKEDYSLQNLDK